MKLNENYFLEYDKNLTTVDKQYSHYVHNLFSTNNIKKNNGIFLNVIIFIIFFGGVILAARIGDTVISVLLMMTIMMTVVVLTTTLSKREKAADEEIAEQSHEKAMAQKQLAAITLNNYPLVEAGWNYELGIESPHLLQNIQNLRLITKATGKKINYRADWIHYLANLLTVRLHGRRVEIVSMTAAGWGDNDENPSYFRGQLYNFKIEGMNVKSPIILSTISKNNYINSHSREKEENRNRSLINRFFPIINGKFDIWGHEEHTKAFLTVEMQEIIARKFNLQPGTRFIIFFSNDRMIVAVHSESKMLTTENAMYSKSIDDFIAEWPIFTSTNDLLNQLQKSLESTLLLASNLGENAKEIEALANSTDISNH